MRLAVGSSRTRLGRSRSPASSRDTGWRLTTHSHRLRCYRHDANRRHVRPRRRISGAARSRLFGASIMRHVSRADLGLCGLFTRDRAMTRIAVLAGGSGAETALSVLHGFISERQPEVLKVTTQPGSLITGEMRRTKAVAHGGIPWRNSCGVEVSNGTANGIRCSGSFGW